MLGQGLELFDAITVTEKKFTAGNEGLLTTILLIPIIATVGGLIAAHLDTKKRASAVQKLLPYLKPFETKIATAHKAYTTAIDSFVKMGNTEFKKHPHFSRIDTEQQESLETFTKTVASRILGTVKGTLKGNLEYLDNIDGCQVIWDEEKVYNDYQNNEDEAEKVNNKLSDMVDVLCKKCSTKQCELTNGSFDYGFYVWAKKLYLGITDQELEKLKSDIAKVLKSL